MFLVAATSFASSVISTPLDRRYEACMAPLQWHVCGDGWAGCCSVSPCKGPKGASFCPPGNSGPGTPATTPDTPIVNPQIPSTCTTAVTTGTPSSLPDGTSGEPDRMWTERCKEDNSNCNWDTNYYFVSPIHENWSYNTTAEDLPQFHISKDQWPGSYERHAIAHFQGIPAHVKKCRISSYKPWVAAHWAIGGSGAVQIAKADFGDKTFEDVTGGRVLDQITYLRARVNTTDLGTLDFGNGRMRRSFLDNSVIFDCPKSEVVLHFSLSTTIRGDVLFDQVAKPAVGISDVQRSGWVLIYEE